jgi:FNIP Repeat
MDHLPPNLAHLIFGDESIFNQLINNLPPKLEKLVLGNKFNQPITPLPKQLSLLFFGDEFNQPIPELPKSIYSLALGKLYTLPLPPLPKLTFFYFNGLNIAGLDSLPSSITELCHQTLQRTKHCLIYSILTLISLVFGDDFNQPFTPIPSLTKLNFGKQFDHPITVLPPQVCKRKGDESE